MIISASRRTDIPAFYGDWFYNRLLENQVVVKNPMNPKSAAKITLTPDNVDCIVFWTKNPKNFIKYLDKINDLGYNYYFLFTVTSYDTMIEKNVGKKAGIIETFLKLSEKIGKEKVIWRYDPILLNQKYNLEYHAKWFDFLCEQLHNYTRKCIISFIDVNQYHFLKQNMIAENIFELDTAMIQKVSEIISNISKNYSLQIATCSESIDLEKYGFIRNRCIDDKLIKELFGIEVSNKKDSNQRDECGCVESRDIGSYDTCLHNCIYCYAQKGRNCPMPYDINSPMLCDNVSKIEKITTLYIKPRKVDNYLLNI